jgi:hypothetical protein
MDRHEVLAACEAADVRLVRFLYCDNGGLIRGKVVPVERLAERMAGGQGLTVAMQAMNMLDELQPIDRMGPVGEVRLVPDPDSFVVVPYAPRTAAMTCDLVALDRSPWGACPRSFLRRMIERLAARDGRTAGVALALAASIKLYPVLFLPFLLASGERRAALSCAVAGAVLALASVAWAGWPLHAEFLALVGQIGRTALITNLSYNLDAQVAMYCAACNPEPLVTAVAGGFKPAAFFVVGKSPLWRLAGAVLLLGVVALLCRRFARTPDPWTRHALVWPAAIALVALTGPFAWSYYFLPVIAAAPVLLQRYGAGAGAAMIAVLYVPLDGYLMLVPTDALPMPRATAAFVALAVLSALLLRPPKPPQNGRTTLPE